MLTVYVIAWGFSIRGGVGKTKRVLTGAEVVWHIPEFQHSAHRFGADSGVETLCLGIFCHAASVCCIFICFDISIKV